MGATGFACAAAFFEAGLDDFVVARFDTTRFPADLRFFDVCPFAAVLRFATDLLDLVFGRRLAPPDTDCRLALAGDGRGFLTTLGLGTGAKTSLTDDEGGGALGAGKSIQNGNIKPIR